MPEARTSPAQVQGLCQRKEPTGPGGKREGAQRSAELDRPWGERLVPLPAQGEGLEVVPLVLAGELGTSQGDHGLGSYGPENGGATEELKFRLIRLLRAPPAVVWEMDWSKPARAGAGGLNDCVCTCVRVCAHAYVGWCEKRES